MHETNDIFQNNPTTDENMNFLSLETQQTQAAINEAQAHPFHFGYEHAFKEGLIQAEWIQDKIHFSYNGAKENDTVWFGNCVDDARAHLHHAPPHSILSEIDHSQLYSLIFSGEQSSVYNWRDANELVRFSPNNRYWLESGQINPYCEIVIDGRAYIIFFLIQVNTNTIEVTMRCITDTSNQSKQDGFTYSFLRNDLANKADMIAQFQTTDEMREDMLNFPKNDAKIILAKMKDGLAAIIATLPN